jgi:hypothetical protein
MGMVDKRSLKQRDWAMRGHHHKRGKKGKIISFFTKYHILSRKPFVD